MARSLVSLVERVAARAEQSPDRLAYTLLVDGGAQEAHLTFREADAQARVVAGYLQSRLAPGDRALLVYPTSLAFAGAFLGCLYAGVVAVPVPEPLVERFLVRIAGIAKASQARAILTTAELLPLLEKWATPYPDLKAPRWVATDALEPAWAGGWRPPKPAADTLAFLQFTSGSTGAPRGVMVTHGNLDANCAMLAEAAALSSDTNGVGWLPLFHDMGLLTQVVLPAYLGCRCTLLSPVAFLQRPLRWIKALARHGGYYTAAPDFAYALAARKATPEACAGLDLRGWRVAANAAEPVRPATLRAFAEAFAPYGFRPEAMRPGYGLAEATLIVSMSGLQPPVTLAVDAAAFEQNQVQLPAPGAPTRALTACGPTDLGDQEVAIVHPETRQPCAPNAVGEIWVRGANVAAGYWDQPEDTAATFQASLADSGAGPYLRTGDLGFIYDGQLYIAGRLKDLIIIDGGNHYPQDLEQTIEAAHPALRPNTAIAFSVDRDGQERLVVAVELPGHRQAADAVDPLAVAQAVRAALAAQHGLHLDDLVFIKPRTLPKTSSGKVQRRACRAAYLAQTLERW
ncbi:MAG: fatty acyl-AMP ligase [Anaerolineales bacterium]|nr:fatty acyl-AMP ligase [Anaerolineales bacterium]